MPATKYECLLCTEKHTIKSEDYGKHLMKYHAEKILTNSSMYNMTIQNVKTNKLPYIAIYNNKQMIVPHEEAYLCLCCNMYYNKMAFVNKHSHKDFDKLTVHNTKLGEYLEQYADKVKYNINGKKEKKDVQNVKTLGYEVVYKLVPENSWTGTTNMVQVVDQEATLRNKIAYEATQPKPEPTTTEESVPKKHTTTEPKPEAGAFPVEFILKMLKQTFKELSVKEEELYISKRFQNNLLDKLANNEDITTETIEEESQKLTEDIAAMELEEAERLMLESICPKPMLKKLGMTYDELYIIMKS